METYGDRLKHLIEHLELNENSFASSLGMQRTDTIYFITNGKTKDPRNSLSESIKKAYPEVDLNWLNAGDGQPFISKTEVNELNKRIEELEKKLEYNKLKAENRIFNILATKEQKEAIEFLNTK